MSKVSTITIAKIKFARASSRVTRAYCTNSQELTKFSSCMINVISLRIGSFDTQHIFLLLL